MCCHGLAKGCTPATVRKVNAVLHPVPDVPVHLCTDRIHFASSTVDQPITSDDPVRLTPSALLEHAPLTGVLVNPALRAH